MSPTIHNMLAVMAQSDLTTREWFVLSLIANKPERSMIELYEFQHLPRSTFARLVQRLREAGLLQTKADLLDYRREFISLSTKGQALLDSLNCTNEQLKQPGEA